MKTLLALALATTSIASGQPNQQWAQGDPSAQEQYAVELLNRFWSNPSAFVARYINLYPVDSNMSAIVAAVQAQNNALNGGFTMAQAAAYYVQQNSSTATAVPPLALYPLLSQQAAAVREEQGITSLTNEAPALYQIFDWTPPAWYALPSVGSSVIPMSLLVNPMALYEESHVNQPAFSGPNATGGTASVAAGNYNASAGTGDDQGYAAFSGWLFSPSLMGPREFLVTNCNGGNNGNLVHQTSTSEHPSSQVKHLRLMGVNLGARQASPGSGNTLFSVFELENEAITTNDFPSGAANTAFVTGACYVDSNHNGEYDPGEGVSGLTVTINGSPWYAITATAGGYSIPVQVGAGTLTVTATGTIGGQAVTQTQTVTIANDNVWLEFSFEPSKPAQSATIPPGNGQGQLINLSTRGWTTAGTGNLVAGLVISGPATAQKTVLLRGAAYSLYPYGITTPLSKPLLTVYDSHANVIATETTQQTDADLFVGNGNNPSSKLRPVFNQVGAFPFIPTGSGSNGYGDTAIILTLAPGAYTFTVTPAPDTPANAIAGGASIQGPPYQFIAGSNQPNGAAGIVLAEVYDVSVTDGAKLINISTRGPVMLGQGQMVVGFTVTGPSTATKRLLVRGAGPALAGYGISNFLPDPVLTIYNADTSVLMTNEGWEWGTQGTQIASLGGSLYAFPFADPSVDSAAIILVGPGSHTASVTSASALQSDIAIVEVYDGDNGP